MLAVVNYEGLSMLKKHFILWYAFIHSAKKKKGHGDMLLFVSVDIFLWTLCFLYGLKCLHMDEAGRKVKESKEQHKAFTNTHFYLKMN